MTTEPPLLPSSFSLTGDITITKLSRNLYNITISHNYRNAIFKKFENLIFSNPQILMNIPSQPQAVLYLLHPFSIQKINGGISIKVSNKMVNSNNSIFHRISSGNFSNVSFTFSDTPIHFGFGFGNCPNK